jgi:hypothetical protein
MIAISIRNMFSEDQLDVGQHVKTEWKPMLDRYARNFVHNLIRENAHQDLDGYSLDVDSLSTIDKKLYLSHIGENADIEAYRNGDISFDALYLEYRKHMQRFIDAEIEEVYLEDMHEWGLVSRIDGSNGETLWYKR